MALSEMEESQLTGEGVENEEADGSLTLGHVAGKKEGSGVRQPGLQSLLSCFLTYSLYNLR